MGEHRLPRGETTNTGDEHFKVFEAATGKTIPMRELTDEQLARHITEANEASKEVMMQAIQMIGQANQLGRVCSCLEYERDRRSRQIIKVLQ